MSGGWKQAKLAGRRPLDGRVSPLFTHGRHWTWTSQRWILGKVLSRQRGRQSFLFGCKWPIRSAKCPAIAPAIRGVEVRPPTSSYTGEHSLSESLVVRSSVHTGLQLLVSF